MFVNDYKKCPNPKGSGLTWIRIRNSGLRIQGSGRNNYASATQLETHSALSPVAKSGNVRHLCVGEAEELVPVLVLHLHDVEHALHPLLHAPLDDLQRNVQ
jgi:hypothetical protein